MILHHRCISRWLWPGNRILSEMASMVVTLWIGFFFAKWKERQMSNVMPEEKTNNLLVQYSYSICNYNICQWPYPWRIGSIYYTQWICDCKCVRVGNQYIDRLCEKTTKKTMVCMTNNNAVHLYWIILSSVVNTKHMYRCVMKIQILLILHSSVITNYWIRYVSCNITWAL